MEIKELIDRIVSFRNIREWKQFHNPKDLVISLVLESSELLEHFQWKNEYEINDHIKDQKSDIANEIADVFYWVLLISHDFEIDLVDALMKKMIENEIKYPIDKSKGNHIKYNKL